MCDENIDEFESMNFIPIMEVKEILQRLLLEKIIILGCLDGMTDVVYEPPPVLSVVIQNI